MHVGRPLSRLRCVKKSNVGWQRSSPKGSAGFVEAVLCGRPPACGVSGFPGVSGVPGVPEVPEAQGQPEGRGRSCYTDSQFSFSRGMIRCGSDMSDLGALQSGQPSCFESPAVGPGSPANIWMTTCLCHHPGKRCSVTTASLHAPCSDCATAAVRGSPCAVLGGRQAASSRPLIVTSNAFCPSA